MLDIPQLERGDIVCNLRSGESYVVLRPALNGASAIGVRHVDIDNPNEWTLFSRSERVDGNKKREG